MQKIRPLKSYAQVSFIRFDPSNQITVHGLYQGTASGTCILLAIMRSPSFIPAAGELRTLTRDLCFYPSTPDDLRQLTRSQVEAFNRDGYLTPIPVFEEEEIADVRCYFDELLARALAEGRDSYSISTAHLRHGRVFDLLTDSRIVSFVRDLLGGDLVGWGSHFFCKMPGDGKRVSWHQDASYWPLTPSKTVTVWLAIDDADAENACMRFIPGSHRFGHLTYTLTENDDSNLLTQTVQGVEGLGTPVNNVLKAGEVSIHSDLLVHGSEANASNRRRCGLTLRYCAAEVRAELGWNLKGVIVNGADISNHWADPKRPDTD